MMGGGSGGEGVGIPRLKKNSKTEGKVTTWVGRAGRKQLNGMVENDGLDELAHLGRGRGRLALVLGVDNGRECGRLGVGAGAWAWVWALGRGCGRLVVGRLAVRWSGTWWYL